MTAPLDLDEIETTVKGLKSTYSYAAFRGDLILALIARVRELEKVPVKWEEGCYQRGYEDGKKENDALLARVRELEKAVKRGLDIRCFCPKDTEDGEYEKYCDRCKKMAMALRELDAGEKTHEKTWSCIKPGSDGCDGNHK